MEIIVAKVPKLALKVSEEAEAERKVEIERAQAITVVSSTSEADKAGRRCKALKTLANDAEKDRKKFKAIVTEMGKAIDAAAKKYVEPIEVELKRIGALTTVFLAEEEERVRKENERIQAERDAAIAKQREAEEAAKAAQEKLLEESSGLSEMEQAVLAEEMAKQTKDQAEEVIRQENVERHKPTGAVFRKMVLWEITDVAKVYAAHPEWFELVPKRSLINAVVTEDFELDGLKVWTERRTGFRS